jgi:hypothetical protein
LILPLHSLMAMCRTRCYPESMLLQCTLFLCSTICHVVPHQSANGLCGSAIPPKVDEAFKNFRYVPYSSLTSATCIKVACGEEDIVFNAQGGLTVKALDWCNEKLISAVDWHAAAHAAEEWICSIMVMFAWRHLWPIIS